MGNWFGIPKVTGYFLTKVILAILLVFIVWRVPAVTEGGWRLRLVKGAWSFLVPGILVSILRFIVISIYNARHTGRNVRGNFVLGINRLVVVINATLFVIAAMIIFGINPVEFLMGMTIVAMAIAVTFKDYITNMLSGLFIMFSDQLSIGDFIEVDGHSGQIVDITFSSIVLKNGDEDVVTVPNNMVFTHPLKNQSAHKSGSFTVKFDLPFEKSVHTSELEKFLYMHFPLSGGFKECRMNALQVDEIGKDFVTYKIEFDTERTDIYFHKKIENYILRKVTEFTLKTDLST